MFGLSDKFRIVIIDEDTHREIKSFRLSKTMTYVIMLLGFVSIALLIYAALAYTPMKYLIPGYGEVESNQAFVQLNKQISSLEKEVEDQRAYIQGLKGYFNPTGQEIQLSDTVGYKQIDRITADDILWHSPIQGQVSAAFDPSDDHYGTDIVAAADTPIKAIQSGIVINADWSSDTGHTITLLHDHGLVSIYKHNSRLLKKLADKIQAGETIAIIGNTGKRTTGPHVHIELWQDNSVLNPEKFLRFN